MAVVRDRPYMGQNFTVDLGDGAEAGFVAVSGLETWLDVAGYREGADREQNRRLLTGLARAHDVTLVRGFTGQLDLYRWFDQVRDGGEGRRDVTVRLFSEDRSAVVATWRLLRAQPIGYAVGALDAAGCGPATERLTLAYDRLEME